MPKCILEISKEKMQQVFKSDGGKMVLNGMVLKNEKDLKETINLYKFYQNRPGCFKILGAAEHILFFRFLKRKKQ
jgi:hypothetical protein